MISFHLQSPHPLKSPAALPVMSPANAALPQQIQPVSSPIGIQTCISLDQRPNHQSFFVPPAKNNGPAGFGTGKNLPQPANDSKEPWDPYRGWGNRLIRDMDFWVGAGAMAIGAYGLISSGKHLFIHGTLAAIGLGMVLKDLSRHGIGPGRRFLYGACTATWGIYHYATTDTNQVLFGTLSAVGLIMMLGNLIPLSRLARQPNIQMQQKTSRADHSSSHDSIKNKLYGALTSAQRARLSRGPRGPVMSAREYLQKFGGTDFMSKSLKTELAHHGIGPDFIVPQMLLGFVEETKREMIDDLRTICLRREMNAEQEMPKGIRVSVKRFLNESLAGFVIFISGGNSLLVMESDVDRFRRKMADEISMIPGVVETQIPRIAVAKLESYAQYKRS